MKLSSGVTYVSIYDKRYHWHILNISVKCRLSKNNEYVNITTVTCAHRVFCVVLPLI